MTTATETECRPIDLHPHELQHALSLESGETGQFRRIIKPQPEERSGLIGDGGGIFWRGQPLPLGRAKSSLVRRSPYGQPGDSLWVREMCWIDKEVCDAVGCLRAFFVGTDVRFEDGRTGEAPFASTEEMLDIGSQRRVPSSAMPRWASRLSLRLTDVRAQRVQEISERDAIAEGVLEDGWEDSVPGGPICTGYVGRIEFQNLWNSIHGPDAWERNDWVWALTFETRGANEVKPMLHEGERDHGTVRRIALVCVATCYRCDEQAERTGPGQEAIGKMLRQAGWGKRGRHWHCPRCMGRQVGVSSNLRLAGDS